MKDKQAVGGAGSSAVVVDAQTPKSDLIAGVQQDAKVADSQAQIEEVKVASEEQKRAIIDLVEKSEWLEATRTFMNIRANFTVENSLIQEIEQVALKVVRPIPASEFARNAEGYRFLSIIRPEITIYSEKASEYFSKQRDAEFRARQALLSRLHKKEDKIEGITWYQHPNRPKYTNSRSTVFLYIGERDGRRPWLIMKIQYAARDWLFVERVEAWHDGVKETLFSGEFDRDNNTTIWEWVDVAPSPYQLQILRSLGSANEAILRFHGMQYRRDVTLSSGDKRALREMLDAFDAITQ